MSLTIPTRQTFRDDAATRLLVRLGIVLGAMAIVFAGLQAVGWLASSAIAIHKPVQNPFGLTLREVQPGYTGLGALILSMQAQFYGLMTSAVTSLKAGDTALSTLVMIGFLYGVFHAAGPGHGKGVISAYVLSRQQSLFYGAGLSLGAALLQAVVAIALIATFRLIAGSVGVTLGETARSIEILSFAAVAAFGAFLLWRKSTSLLPCFGFAAEATGQDLDLRAALPRSDSGILEPLCVVLAAGIRPCSGAILLLVFSSSVGLFWEGVAGAFAMAAGTAVTTSTIASIANLVRSALARFSRKGGKGGEHLFNAAEICAAAFICTFGTVLLTGFLGTHLPGVID